MRGAASFGLLLGLTMVTLHRLLPPTVASEIWWSAVGVMALVMTTVVWRRTKLRLATASIALGAVLSAAVVFAAFLGKPWPNLATEYWFVVAPLVLVSPGLMFLDARRHPSEHKRWRVQAEKCTLRDMLLLRHVPDLRHRT